MAHILIVDDEAAIRLMIRTRLESVGHRVFEAEDGGVALDILETYPHPFDIVILDFLMPAMDGVGFLSTLNNRSAYPPIIVLSTLEETIPQALEHLISGHLTKPISQRELIDTVNSLVNLKVELPSS